MHREPVKSSMMRSIGYDPLLHKVEVEYQNGALVEYQGVSQEEWVGFGDAESKGKWVQQTLKPGREFRYLGRSEEAK